MADMGNYTDADSPAAATRSLRYALIVAGGKGSRAGAGRPKQFVELSGLPMIFRTIHAFSDYDPTIKIVVVMNAEFMDVYKMMCRDREFDIPHSIVAGGTSRAESVWNGLRHIAELLKDTDIPAGTTVSVAIHDAARPLVTGDMIGRGFNALGPGVGVIPVVRSVNSLRRLKNRMPGSELGDIESVTVDRSEYVEVQTPQIFNYDEIVSAYVKAGDLRGFTDDASVAESQGLGIRLYEGDRRNIKVTSPEDFAIAETLLKQVGGES